MITESHIIKLIKKYIKMFMCCCVGSTIGEGEPEGLAKMGSIYVDSDTDTIYYSTGTEWIEIPSGGDTSNFVTLDGDQTIDDVKTFSESPIVPEPTTDQQAASKKYVDDNAGGGLPKVCLVEVYTDPEDSEITYLTILYNNTGRTPSTDAYGNVLLSGAYVNYFVSGCRSDDDVVMGTEYNKYTLDWGSGLMCTANPMPTNYLTPITIKFEIYE